MALTVMSEIVLLILNLIYREYCQVSHITGTLNPVSLRKLGLLALLPLRFCLFSAKYSGYGF